MKDQYDLSTVKVFNSPEDIATWPITVGISKVALGDGVHIETDRPIPDSWDFHMPGWGDGSTDKGNLLYTVWAVAVVNGAAAASGFIQMWRGREWTGAPVLSEFARNWAYDSRWGSLKGHQPAAGDRMGFFISAGNARNERAVTSVRQRSNVVIVTLAPSGVFTFQDDQAPQLPQEPPPAGTVVTPSPTTGADLASLAARLDRIEATLNALAARPDPAYSGSFADDHTITLKPERK